MTLLHEVGDGQAIVPKPRREGDHEAHMRMGQLMQGAFVMILAPKNRQRPLLLAFEKRRRHRRLDELPPDPCQLRHLRLPLSAGRSDSPLPMAPSHSGRAPGV